MEMLLTTEQNFPHKTYTTNLTKKYIQLDILIHTIFNNKKETVYLILHIQVDFWMI